MLILIFTARYNIARDSIPKMIGVCAFRFYISLTDSWDGGKSSIFRAASRGGWLGILARGRSQARRSSVAGLCNRRINTILLLLYVRCANWARWICAPSHAVTYTAREQTHAHTDAVCTRVTRTCIARCDFTHTRGKARSDRAPIQSRSMNEDAPPRRATTKQTHPCNWQIDRLIQSHRRCFFFVRSFRRASRSVPR